MSNQKLTLKELRMLVMEAVNQSLNEFDETNVATIRNSPIRAQQNQLKGIPNNHPRKTNLDKITRGIDLEPRATDYLMTSIFFIVKIYVVWLLLQFLNLKKCMS